MAEILVELHDGSMPTFMLRSAAKNREHVYIYGVEYQPVPEGDSPAHALARTILSSPTVDGVVLAAMLDACQEQLDMCGDAGRERERVLAEVKAAPYWCKDHPLFNKLRELGYGEAVDAACSQGTTASVLGGDAADEYLKPAMTDTFTGTFGAALNAHTGDAGGYWSTWNPRDGISDFTLNPSPPPPAPRV
jgi:hypothetical protein